MNTNTSIERIVHNLKTAKNRIENRDKDFYNINNLSDLTLGEKDFMSAKEMHEKEAHIVFNGDSALTQEGLFRGVVYCLLTPLQKYQGQVNGFSSVFDDKFDLIAGNANDEENLAICLKDAGVLFYQQKARYIQGARHTLGNFDFLSNIKMYVGTNRESEFKIREELTKDVKGLGLKTSSLFLRMCGAKYIIPVDSWMMEMLYFHGYPCEMPRSKVERIRWETKDRTSIKQRKKGLSEKQYLEAENFAHDLAKKYDVPGYILQLAFWTKKSSYER